MQLFVNVSLLNCTLDIKAACMVMPSWFPSLRVFAKFRNPNNSNWIELTQPLSKLFLLETRVHCVRTISVT